MIPADYGLLLLRIGVGAFFFSSGFRKTFNREVHEHIAGYMKRLGVGNPVMNWVIPLAELFGGLALLLGFITSLAASGLVIIMLGAIYLTCWPKVCAKHPTGPMTWWTALCMEPEVLLLVILATLTLCGGGAFSADALITHIFEEYFAHP